ncbi:MAG: phosphate ABC transporter permease PstA [Leptolyngbyaceae cyanobacterium T60_A2020_046]|nr:phosphate ABC transporter permease PstA [Leptolyngbyaceae cyanobacterium T60_A2020_046]
MVWCRPGVRRGCDRAMTWLYGLATLLTVLPLGAILLDVGRRGSRRLDLALFTQLPPAFGLSGGGIAHALLGSLVVVGLASLITIPLGILAGLYLAELSPHHPIAQGLRLGVNVLSGVPSILAGVFAYGLLVVNGVVGFSAIAGAVALAVLMLPWVVRTTDDALRQVPDELRWAAASVGASPLQSLIHILLPAALPGITTGILLAIARAAGETAPLLFTALNSDFFPKNLVEPVATLSVLIYNFAIAPFPAQQDLAWAAALVLIAAILLLNLIARWLSRKTTAGTP